MANPPADLVAELRAALSGPARFDPGTRALYSTDASNYRQVPTGVVFPRDEDDVAATVAIARRHGVPITTRGAGTSIAGNAIGTGLVLEFARHLNRIVDVDVDRRLARVQPGVVLDSLRSAVAGHGLTFGPDPSTHSRCTLGGMIGNNACGTHSVAWGKTVDNVHSLDVLLSDGTRLEVGATSPEQLDALCARGDRVGRLHQDLRRLRDDAADLVRRSFPDLARRVSGYNLDQLLPENGFHLARALVGSEGSCAVVLGATVQLVSSPAVRALTVLGFPDTYAAADEVPRLRGLGALAIEGLSSELVDVVRQRNPASPALPLLPGGRSWLLVETGGSDLGEAESAARDIVRAMGERADSVVHTDPARIAALWKIREEGSGYSTRMAGSERWSGWEDAAVPPEQLGSYLREFDALLARFGRRGVTYGHYGDGCIHVRIDFDLLSGPGTAEYRSFLEAAADLVVSHGGSVSGEHGDGQARSALLSRMYPPEVIQAFERFKAAFDPEGLLNPGQIVHPRPVDSDVRPLVAPPKIPTRTALALHADSGDLAAATRRCVGMGKCLNTTGGVMCPSYRVTREEKHSTRGRAHLLFEMLAGRVIKHGWRSREVREALDLCLSCKGCKSDCPVDVDMATYKAEFLHQHYRHRLRPAAHYSMGFLPLWLKAGQRAPRLVNRVLSGPLAPVFKRLGGIDARRDVPELATESLQAWWSEQHPRRRDSARVLLFPDTFTNHFDPHIGRDAVTALEALGHAVEIPREPVCCGLTWHSTGQLGTARRAVRRTARLLRPQLDRGLPVIGLEPSCTAFLRNDAVELAPDDLDVAALAAATRTFAEWVEPTREQWQQPAQDRQALVQVHCHQHAELGFAADQATLDATGTRARVLDAGCCGLAGNFGFERGHHEVSMACAEQGLLPAVRAAEPGTDVVADGFSCRTQLRQASDVEPVHLATLVARALDGTQR
ncbi:FAD-binding and (Fe-S)-binding domain-containing protein [Saccharopolyspora sp. WRP15-2]|uniref:FAD-binding and (Fe-S)-binding domain-containing protein n=1 Tax=Saccharopolyspora oryzae TaxID=2997343 RepID=A0ABT4V474_9PSEU|nr:FAD-binding and (Fe-S)-binding domain-containing protein [Saccharopolyspora oryzae]MDA3628748.1 FAD-binding and (Fe-S)-binding domain-containing protein [Saccharopolyspora oryzae]